MSWKHVFNGHLRGGWTRGEAANKARWCGYRFLSFSGIVWFVPRSLSGDVHDTGIKTEELT